jgi:hypothetical protein
MKINTFPIKVLFLSLSFHLILVLGDLWTLTDFTIAGGPQLNVSRATEVQFDFTLYYSPTNSIRCKRSLKSSTATGGLGRLGVPLDGANGSLWFDCHSDLDMDSSLRWKSRNMVHSNGTLRSLDLEVAMYSNKVKP